MTPCERTTRALAGLLGSKSPLGPRERGHLRECTSCRARYEALIGFERALSGEGARSELPSPFELARAGARVLGEARPASALARLARLRASWRLALAAGLATAAAMALFAVRTEPPARQARGTPFAFALRAFCQLPGGGVLSLSDEPGPAEASACPVTGAIAFGVLADEPGRLHVLIAEPEGSLRWLTEESGLEVAASRKLVPLALELEPSAGPGEYQVIALLAPGPVNREQVEEAVRREGPSAARLSQRLGARARALAVHFNPLLPGGPP